MDKALYIAMSGAKQNMLAQAAHANNLANANTTGFKQDFAQARSMKVFGEGHDTRAYAMAERPGTDMSSGSLNETGRSLDIAVHGEGWIAVQSDGGTEAFTRRGDLAVDVNGILRNGEGLPVLGNGGPIALPPASQVEVGADGTISVIPIGGAPDQMVEIDRIKLVNPPARDLVKGEDGLVRRKPDVALEGVEPADAMVTVEPGFLETSNVNAISALIQTLELSRQYEMQVKVMSSADQNGEVAARLLQNL
ncbi:flagellar basal body rod protein FlgF [Hydrocarboniclastica marina]|uniref:Flagellar basal-body rod protein FlgF n=1 Tax=Hydrocarboniclastica marina TaxID=2259620 RepID=A0A4P7XJ17_9ALTE|nr:flagellar basal body rod protein FlgF [Hydrocarboniclastica marina]MAL98379.1 flagellar biosynthesis protein FlgF [Alteromonadaceae bacterium]QCF25857.1 flagellar basal body rod protein FlgF [Hydrocarboniclastica marina]|tara:strand:+ start:1082 stop:1834 length:753 start_codon:yes stop_codon:yes gene_type:complete